MNLDTFFDAIKPRGWTLTGSGEIVRQRDYQTVPLVHVARQHSTSKLGPDAYERAAKILGLRGQTSERITYAARVSDDGNPMRLRLLRATGLNKKATATE